MRYSLNTAELGVVVSMLRRLWEIWKRFGLLVGDLVARVMLTVFYVVLFGPVGIGVRLFADPLRIKAEQSSRWSSRPETEHSREQAGRLF